MESLIQFPTNLALRHQRVGSTHTHSSEASFLCWNAIILSAASLPLISALSGSKMHQQGIFFSWAHNFKAFPQLPCGRSLVRAGERWNQRIDNSSEILFHIRLLCLLPFHACSAPQCGRTASSWMYLHYGSVDPVFRNMQLSGTKRRRSHTQIDYWQGRTRLEKKEKSGHSCCQVLYKQIPAKVPKLPVHSQRN